MAAKTTAANQTTTEASEPTGDPDPAQRTLAIIEPAPVCEMQDDDILDAIILSDTVEEQQGVVLMYDATLDEDDDTSLCTSLRLHLMSEHHMPEALHASDEDNQNVHRRQHALRKHAHTIHDLRFRPGRALGGLFLQYPDVLDVPATVVDLPTQVARA
jgi:hypothetical protein